MPTSSRVIPFHQLPPGFGRTLDIPPDASATPRPASTLVLMRNGPDGLETLLLKRSPGVGFIPGAYVFPGGRVDPEDASPSLLPRLAGLTPQEADARLGMVEGVAGGDRRAAPPAAAFFVTAIRETFEETGILLGAPPAACRTIPRGAGGEIRAMLLDGRRSFLEVIDELGVDLDAGGLQFIAHWVTPEPEPRRYDTRFFAAEVPPDCPVEPDLREIEEALWLTPAEALIRNRAGVLPLVFPTLRTLEDLADFRQTREALDALRGRAVTRLLPRLARRAGGIQITVVKPG